MQSHSLFVYAPGSVPSWLVHVTLNYVAGVLIRDLRADVSPTWWRLKLFTCPSLMVHLDLFSAMADGSRLFLGWIARVLPWWHAIVYLNRAAHCYDDRPGPVVPLVGHLLRPAFEPSFACAYWLNLTATFYDDQHPDGSSGAWPAPQAAPPLSEARPLDLRLLDDLSTLFSAGNASLPWIWSDASAATA